MKKRILPYEEVTRDEYAEVAARTFTATEPAAGTVVLAGPCPRCKDVFSMPVTSGQFKIAGRWRATARRADAFPEGVPIICLCDEEHPNRPHDRNKGCGAYWRLRISGADR